LPVDGGVYMIVAHAPGVPEWSQEVSVNSEADIVTVDVPDVQQEAKLPSAPSAPPPGASLTLRSEKLQPKSHRPNLLWPIATSASAVVLLGSAFGLSRWASTTYDDAKAEQVDQDRRDSLEASANRKRYFAEGLAIAGVGCGGVAVWLYFRQRYTPRKSATGHTKKILLMPSTSGFAIVGKF
jgi:hypothetical protein